MNAMTPALDSGLIERLRVEQLFAAYIHCLDEGQLEAWPDFFVEDCIYGIWPRENWDAGLPMPLLICTNRRMLHDRILAHREANIYPLHWNRHFSSGVTITGRSGGMLEVTSNYLVVQTRQEGETSIYQAGRCYDKLVEEAGVLKFKERKVVYDTLRVQTLLVTPI